MQTNYIKTMKGINKLEDRNEALLNEINTLQFQIDYEPFFGKMQKVKHDGDEYIITSHFAQHIDGKAFAYYYVLAPTGDTREKDTEIYVKESILLKENKK